MAYEHDPITGRSTAERQDFIRTKGSSGAAPWLLAAAVVAALVALLWFFGGTADQTPATAPGVAPTTGSEVAPMGTAPAIGDGTAPATGGEIAPAPAAPLD